MEEGANIVILGRNKEKLDLLCADFPEKKIIPVALDIGNVKMVREHIRVLKDQLPHIDVLINSAGTNSRNHFLEFEEEDYDKGIEKLRQEYDIPLILLSMGKDGSRAYYKDLRVEQAPFLQKETIETTGAGDTFGGCCLHFVLKYGLDGLNEERLSEMLTFANAAASIVTTRKGALRVMPEPDEVERFIGSR